MNPKHSKLNKKEVLIYHLSRQGLMNNNLYQIHKTNSYCYNLSPFLIVKTFTSGDLKLVPLPILN